MVVVVVEGVEVKKHVGLLVGVEGVGSGSYKVDGMVKVSDKGYTYLPSNAPLTKEHTYKLPGDQGDYKDGGRAEKSRNLVEMKIKGDKGEDFYVYQKETQQSGKVYRLNYIEEWEEEDYIYVRLYLNEGVEKETGKETYTISVVSCKNLVTGEEQGCEVAKEIVEENFNTIVEETIRTVWAAGNRMGTETDVTG